MPSFTDKQRNCTLYIEHFLGDEVLAKKTTQNTYGNESITSLKGADRVRKRPAVIFGSDGIEGCQHSVFEILSNSIDEAREGYGREIIITKFADHSIEIEDFGRAGNWYSASCMQAASIIISKRKAMNFHWD